MNTDDILKRLRFPGVADYELDPGVCAAAAREIERLGSMEKMWRLECEQARVARAERDAAQAKFHDLQKSVMDLAHPNCRMLLDERDAALASEKRESEIRIRAEAECAVAHKMACAAGVQRDAWRACAATLAASLSRPGRFSDSAERAYALAEFDRLKKKNP